MPLENRDRKTHNQYDGNNAENEHKVECTGSKVREQAKRDEKRIRRDNG